MGSLQKKYTNEKLKGKIYTPYYIIDKILDDTDFNGKKILGKKILDPACGNGRFLFKIAERIIKHSPKKNLGKNLGKIYGWDTDKNAIEEANKKLNKLTENLDISIKWNIKTKNALKQNSPKFDFIVGNPPYIRIQHLDLNQRKFIQQNYQFCKSGSTDIYIAFFELATKLLKNNGICGFITPNTYFHTQTGKILRNYFEKNQNLIKITNYKDLQIFNKVITYSAITIFDKKKYDNFILEIANSKNTYKKSILTFNILKNKNFWQLGNIKTTKISGEKLGNIADIHVGVTTLADKIYIMPFIKKEKKYIYLKSKNKGIIKIEKNILKPIIKASRLKKSTEKIKEYIIFPYYSSNNKKKIIPEHIFKEKYPFAYKYLLSQKQILDRRDNGKPNKAAWYAFGRSQGLQTSFGEKILFSPMNKKPNFILSKNKNATFYSGYCIKYKGDYNFLLKQLNSERLKKFIDISSRDFRDGWKAYNKKIVQEFIIKT